MSDTPRVEALISSFEFWDGVPRSITELARTLERELAAEKQRSERLEKALRELYEDQMEYIKINHLCGAENNLVLRNARAALGDSNG